MTVIKQNRFKDERQRTPGKFVPGAVGVEFWEDIDVVDERFFVGVVGVVTVLSLPMYGWGVFAAELFEFDFRFRRVFGAAARESREIIQ